MHKCDTENNNNKRLQVPFTHARVLMVRFFHSVALAPKKTNFVSRIIGQFIKSALLPLCQPCIQFCFYTSFLLGLNKCCSNFHRIYNMENLKRGGRDGKKIHLLALQLCKKKNKFMLLYTVQIQPVVPDP